MKISRLMVRDFRGIRERELLFSEKGVNLICGPNESGKSSMLLAILTVLREKHSTKREDVKQLKPVGRDVGPEVELEFSLAGRQVVLNKRFLKGPRTEIRVSGAENFQLSGGEAHGWVESLLQEHMDWPLFESLLLLQGKASAPLGLVGMNSLEAVLGREASLEAQENQEPLFEAVEAEFGKYFTGKGGEKKERSDKRAALAAMQEDVNSGKREIEALELELRDIRRDEGLIADLEARKRELEERIQTVNEKANAFATEEKALSTARWGLREAEHQRDRVREVHLRREHARKELQGLRESLLREEEELKNTVERWGAQREILDGMRTSLGSHFESIETLRVRVQTAEKGRERASLLEKRNRLEALWKEIEEVLHPREALPFRVPTKDEMVGFESRWRELENLRATLKQGTASFRLTALADLEIHASGDSRPRVLRPNETWEGSFAECSEWTLPGVLHFEMADSSQDALTRETLAQVETALENALQPFGTTDMTVLRQRLEAGIRWNLEEENRKRVLQRLVESRSVESIQQEIEAIRRTLEGASDESADEPDEHLHLDDLRQQLHEAELEGRENQAASQAQLSALNQIEQRKVQAETTIGLLRTQIEGMEKIAASTPLADSEPDAGETLEGCEARVREKKTACEAIATRMAALGGERIQEEWNQLRQSRERLEQEMRTLREKLIEKRVHLRARGDMGLAEILAEKESRLFSMQRALEAEDKRAAAVETLRSALLAARDASRARYRLPFQEKVNQLGAHAYGTDSFSVELGDALEISARNLGGTQVPWDGLSGGAQEQLDIIARVAAGLLVAKSDPVPLFLDETLVYSDPDRRWFLGSLIQWLGKETQVFVLTSDRSRFAGIVSESKLIALESLA